MEQKQPAGIGPVERVVRPGADAFADWYAANEQYLTTQPYTNYVAAASWNAGQAAEQKRWANALAGMAKAAADNNDLRVYELLRGLNDALYRA